MPNMYCPMCNKKHFVIHRIVIRRFKYKGHILKYKARTYMCKDSPIGYRFFEDSKMVFENINKIKAAIEEFENDWF